MKFLILKFVFSNFAIFFQKLEVKHFLGTSNWISSINEFVLLLS